MKHLRVLLQMGYSLAWSIYFLYFLIRGIEFSAIPFLFFTVVWCIACFWALRGNAVGERILRIYAWLLLAFGVLLQIMRIAFILKYGGMERPGGVGSPLAFILGWIYMTVAFFIPGLFFVIWNVLSRRIDLEIARTPKKPETNPEEY